MFCVEQVLHRDGRTEGVAGHGTCSPSFSTYNLIVVIYVPTVLLILSLMSTASYLHPTVAVNPPPPFLGPCTADSSLGGNNK